jgi:small RNA 2'-O-methyltransferase
MKHEGTELHNLRHAVVVETLLATGATRVLDLGCGDGTLIAALAADTRFTRLTGVDSCTDALAAAKFRLYEEGGLSRERVRLFQSSFDVPAPWLEAHDAVVMVDTIEHVDPRRLSSLEHAQFAMHRPRSIVVTTPNREYNRIYGLPDSAFRHPGHRFEWTRAKFRAWASGAGERNGYAVTFRGIGEPDLVCGCPTQMAVFTRSA